MLNTVAYMWNLEKKGYRWTYLQSRNRDVDVMDTQGGGREWGGLGD